MLDPPLAIAVVIEDGAARVALVTLDLVIARPALRDDLASRVPDLELDALALVATHTHSGPGGYVPGFLAERITAGRFDPEAPGLLVAAAERALRAAANDLVPVHVRTATASLARARNRRCAGGPEERELPVLAFEDEAGRAIALFSYGAHPTVLTRESRAYSGDYPAAAREAFRDAGLRAQFLPGPLGDQAPESPAKASEAARAQELGQAVARAATAALEAAPRGPGALAFSELRVDAPPPALRRFCPLWWLGPALRAPLAEFVSVRAPFQALAIGDAVLALVPAEPESALGERIRQAIDRSFPDRRARFVVSHANDWLGYAVTRESFAAGGYEACVSLHGPDFGDWVAAQASLAVRGLPARGVRR